MALKLFMRLDSNRTAERDGLYIQLEVQTGDKMLESASLCIFRAEGEGSCIVTSPRQTQLLIRCWISPEVTSFGFNGPCAHEIGQALEKP